MAVLDFRMKDVNGLKWSDIIDQAVELDKDKTVQLVPMDIVKYDVKNKIFSLGTTITTDSFTGQAFKQFLAKIGIPQSYFEKCSIDLQEKEMLEALGKVSKNPVQFKMKNNTIYGLVPEVYSANKSQDYLNLIKSNLPASVQINEVYADLNQTLVRGIFGKNQSMLGLYPMMDVRFSEIDFSKFEIKPSLYKVSCTNGMMVSEGSDLVTRVSANKFNDKLVETMLSTSDRRMTRVLGDYITIFEDLKNVPIQNEEEYLTTLQCSLTNRSLRKDYSSVIKDNYVQEGDESIFGVVNSCTAVARDLSLDRKLAIEKDAGSLLSRIKTHRELRASFGASAAMDFDMFKEINKTVLKNKN